MFNFYYTLCILVLTIIFIVKFGKNNPLEMFSLPVKTYVITLQKDKKIEEKFIRFNGIDGENYNYQKEIDKNIIKPIFEKDDILVEMSKKEIGEILSHYYLWKHIENEKNPILVLNNEKQINEKFKDKLNNILMNLPSHWDVYQINNDYLINPTSIKKILKLLPFNSEFKSWLSNNILNK